MTASNSRMSAGRSSYILVSSVQDLEARADAAHQRHPAVNISCHVDLFPLGSHVSTLPVWNKPVSPSHAPWEGEHFPVWVSTRSASGLRLPRPLP